MTLSPSTKAKNVDCNLRLIFSGRKLKIFITMSGFDNRSIRKNIANIPIEKTTSDILLIVGGKGIIIRKTENKKSSNIHFVSVVPRHY